MLRLDIELDRVVDERETLLFLGDELLLFDFILHGDDVVSQDEHDIRRKETIGRCARLAMPPIVSCFLSANIPTRELNLLKDESSAPDKGEGKIETT